MVLARSTPVLLVLLAACSRPEPPAATTVPVTTPAASAAAPAPPPVPPVPDAAATPVDDSIRCESVDDCWVTDDGKPMPRPVKLQGKQFKPCKDGERAPACVSGKCVVRGYKC